MCGICFFLPLSGSFLTFHFLEKHYSLNLPLEKERDQNDLRLLESAQKVLKRRGPDSIRTVEVIDGSKILFHLISSVLFIRGRNVVPQPLEDEKGNILLWNGEIFGGVRVEQGENDTKELLRLLTENPKDIVKVMKNIQGPWAFIYWENREATLWFGRSYMGHRSLLFHLPTETEPFFSISSVAFGDFETNLSDEQQNMREESWQELKTGVYCLKIERSIPSSNLSISVKDFLLSNVEGEVSPFAKRKDIVPPDSFIPSPRGDLLRKFLDVLSEAVKIRVTTLPPPTQEGVPRLGILFSGGIDSIMLAALADRFVPNDEPIDLLNVAFGNMSFDVPDRKTGIQGVSELSRISNRKWNFIEINVTPSDIEQREKHLYSLIYPQCTIMDMTIGAALWFASRGIGHLRKQNMMETNEKREDDLMKSYEEEIYQLILTSIQELVKAEKLPEGMIEKILPSLVVKKTTDKQRKYGHFCSNITFLIHQTKLTSLTPPEVGKLFISHLSSYQKAKLNVSKNGFLNFAVSDLTKKNETKPSKKQVETRNDYTTSVKVLLLGNGADEQLAGYSRHRTAFTHRGWKGLQRELDLDFHRLWKRNLGRDDRLISDNGKEARHPFLDENVINFINSVPLWQVCDLSKPAGIGDKSILRECGKILGLTDSTNLAKRAIQFGSRAGRLFFPSVPSDKIDGSSKFIPK